jgi:plasmid stability protein
MEDEARDILRSAVMAEPGKEVGAGTRLAGYFSDVESGFEIPEMREEKPRPAKFKK